MAVPVVQAKAGTPSLLDSGPCLRKGELVSRRNDVAAQSDIAFENRTFPMSPRGGRFRTPRSVGAEASLPEDSKRINRRAVRVRALRVNPGLMAAFSNEPP